MPRHKNNAAAAGARMKVHPDRPDGGFSEEDQRRAQYGGARKPQLAEEVETVEVDDLDRVSTDHDGDNEMTKAVVSGGRTVDAPMPGKRRLVGQTSDGVQIYGPVFAHYGPGETVTLEKWEVRRLQELGFLVDPSKIEHAIQDGNAGPVAEQEGAHRFFRSTQQ